jgi:hypothetical protein
MSLPSAAPTPLPPPIPGWHIEPRPLDDGWSRRKFYTFLLVVLTFHLALIFLFGAKKNILARPVTHVPHLHLTDDANELVALGDPTLFARPNPHDLASAYWRQLSPPARPNFNSAVTNLYLRPIPENFGAAFSEFTQSSRQPPYPLNFKPEPAWSAPTVPPDDTPPPATTLQITGDLAQREHLTPLALPALPDNDVLPPTTVQALVDPAGNVISAVVIKPGGIDADQCALQLVRGLRFAPAPRLMFGELTFYWHTVPTHTVPAPAP